MMFKGSTAHSLDISKMFYLGMRFCKSNYGCRNVDFEVTTKKSVDHNLYTQCGYMLTLCNTEWPVYLQ